MFKLKRIHKRGIRRALDKAERYRLLNDPKEAESICLDILRVDPANQKAIVMLLLSLTDQFDDDMSGTADQAENLLPRIKGKYERHYYSGIIAERQAKAALKQVSPSSRSSAYEWLREAMAFFEKAEAIRPAGNDEAVLRWNTCARMIMNKNLVPTEEERIELPLD